MNADLFLSDAFRNALDDYFYLLNNHYPQKGALKLVGDRYRLSTDQRTILYRGISSREKATERKSKITAEPSDSLAIDGYNVIFTLLNYRLGRFVFISNDGICRDAGSLFGKIRKDSLFNECAMILIEFLSNYLNTSITIYFDSPVLSSKKHRSLLLQLTDDTNINIDVSLVQSADQSLLNDPSSVLASSDSVIIDNAMRPVLDIPKIIIEGKYGYSLIDLGSLLR